MKAIVYTQYGSPDVLHLKEVAKPVPKENELLIKVKATAVNAADWRFLRANPFFIRFFAGFFKPKNQILGSDIAGVVEAVGRQVTQFQPGDAVYGELGVNNMGGLAEFVCAPENLMAPVPLNLTFEEAAAVPMAALTALQGLRDVGQILAGHKVLIHGASGGVGTFAVQLARVFGAEVTAVCSTSKMDTAKELGADHVIDYTQEDFSQQGQQYDLIFSANGDRSLAEYARALTPNGKFVLAGGSMRQLFQTMLLGPLRSRSGGKSFESFTAHASQKDLLFLNQLLESKKIRSFIDKCYPLADAADAMRYLDAGHARGKIVVVIDSASRGKNGQ